MERGLFIGRLRSLAFRTVALLLLGSRALIAQPTGELQEDIRCEDAPDQSYALYLPSGYAPDRSWPILYCFDPGAHGRVPLERLREAAERFGFIVVGSNNSRNGSWEVSEAAARAVIRDTRRRFKIDDRRLYAAGCSGGARVACEVATRGHFAGVLAASAGFPESTVPARVPFVFYGCAGRTDFNYGEMRRVDEGLGRLGVPHRVVFHGGGHEWIPAALAPAALGWLELQAIRSGLRPRDEAFVAALFQERMAAVRASQQDAEIYFESISIVADFDGLLDVAEPAGNVARLRDSVAVKKFRKEEKKAEQQEKRWLDRLAEAVVTPPREARSAARFGGGDGSGYGSGREDPLAPRTGGADGQFGRERGAGPGDWAGTTADRVAALGPVDPHEALREAAADIRRQAGSNVAALRAIHGFAAVLFAQGSEAEQAGEHEKAMHAYEMSTIVRPDSAMVQFALARACAQCGKKEKGRAALREARANGFADAWRIAELEARLKR